MAKDEDGHCDRCGYEWEDERETLEPHVCPPGFLVPVPPPREEPSSEELVAWARWFADDLLGTLPKNATKLRLLAQRLEAAIETMQNTARHCRRKGEK